MNRNRLSRDISKILNIDEKKFGHIQFHTSAKKFN